LILFYAKELRSIEQSEGKERKTHEDSLPFPGHRKAKKKNKKKTNIG
jgi:hypothetical protein